MRRVYFAFHYVPDISRVNVVRNSGLLQEQAGFFDASLWEKAKSTSDEALKKLINQVLERTTVSVFLIGGQTALRPWVQYELQQTYARGNGLLAIHIEGIKNFQGQSGVRGSSIFDVVRFPNGHLLAGPLFSSLYPSYNWVGDNGYQNFGKWVETAAKAAGK